MEINKEDSATEVDMGKANTEWAMVFANSIDAWLLQGEKIRLSILGRDQAALAALEAARRIGEADSPVDIVREYQDWLRGAVARLLEDGAAYRTHLIKTGSGLGELPQAARENEATTPVGVVALPEAADGTAEDWQNVKAEAMRLLQVELLDSPASHLAYIRTRTAPIVEHGHVEP
ncbi:hypothetical protein [Rhodopseudomonas palustris]|uniref:Uncharacterized protein n=1 Tax=Rhodopseudomonas palustris (strain BisB18) TaxID=316056 RepID=Q213V2_RHOPB